MNRTPILTLVTVASLLGVVGCGKKQRKQDTPPLSTGFVATVADENTLLNRSVTTGSLVIDSVDILGVSATQGASSLRLAESPYDQDRLRVSVYDPSMEALDQVRGILCFFNQASYIDMTGKGPYIAQADMDTCFSSEGDSDSSGEGDQSTGSRKNLVPVWVESTRQSDRHPLVVRAWFSMSETNNEQQEMQVRMVIAEGQSSQNPLGIFRLTWESRDASTPNASNRGYIEARRSAQNGEISLTMADEYGDGDESLSTLVAAVLAYDAKMGEVTGGVVRTRTPDWTAPESQEHNGATSAQISTAEYVASFNATRFLRKDVVQNLSTCLAKDEFDYQVWRYGLYQANIGSRVELNSGFPVTWTEAGKTQYGWAGYWGVWLGDKTDLNGLTVTRTNFETGASSEYSVTAGAGKLIKRSKQSVALSKLEGVEFEAWPHVIAYDPTSNRLKKIGRFVDGSLEYETPTDYNPELQEGVDRQAINLYSRALGGAVVFFADTAGNILGPDIVYYKQENVTGSQAEQLTLYCYSNCLKGSIRAENANQPHYTVDWSNTNWEQRVAAMQQVYTFHPSSMELIDLESNSSVRWVGVEDQEDRGFFSGPMVTAPLAASDNPWGLYEADVYYMWETGNQPHHRHVALRDTQGQTVNFDAPLFLKYTHTQANDRSGVADSRSYGKPFLLQYEGFGKLWGIPSTKETGGFWKAQFALKDGTLLGESQQYKVKALDMDLALREKPANECEGIALANPELPSLANFQSPNNGARPLVNDPPRVVEGVVLSE